MFGDEISDFCDRLELVIYDVNISPSDSFTHASDAHATTSWLVFAPKKGIIYN